MPQWTREGQGGKVAVIKVGGDYNMKQRNGVPGNIGQSTAIAGLVGEKFWDTDRCQTQGHCVEGTAGGS